jgi:alanyl-tRNA synthetase
VETEQTIRIFLDFFRERGHQLVRGGTLIPPPGDPVLFTTSGMHPLTPYLEGRVHPRGRRLTSVQRCLRTTDLDEVGDETHLTAFEMLGSWSLGDYGGGQSLRWGYELLCDGYGIDPGRLHATVFGGDDQVGPDTDSLELWAELGLPVSRNRAENWWSNGPVGPCGPDTEIFAWTGDSPPTGTPGSDPRWVEIWNHVLMRYRRHPDGTLEPLAHGNIDTGMGLERLVMVRYGYSSVFEGDPFRPWLGEVRRLWRLDGSRLRLVCDHLRSSVAIVGDGVLPSNTGRGYVLRRLIRRVLTTLAGTGSPGGLAELPVEPVAQTLDHFGQRTDPRRVLDLLREEQRRFEGLLRRGRREVSRRLSRGPLTEADYVFLHESLGLPRDLLPGGAAGGGPLDGGVLPDGGPAGGPGGGGSAGA